MRLTLIRHAESVGNRSQHVIIADGGLTPEGVGQAERLGTRLRPLDFDRLIASDMRRVTQTVAIALGDGVEPEVDPRWRERDIGDLDGVEFADARVAVPGLFDVRGGDAYHARPPGGESLEDVARRIRPALAEIMSARQGHVVVVCHGGPIKLAVCRLLQIDPAQHFWKFSTDNTSLSTFEIEDGFVKLMRWNDTSHLNASPIRPDRATEPRD